MCSQLEPSSVVLKPLADKTCTTHDFFFLHNYHQWIYSYLSRCISCNSSILRSCFHVFAGISISVNWRCPWFHWHINFPWEGVLIRHSPCITISISFELTFFLISIPWITIKITHQKNSYFSPGDYHCSYIIRNGGISWTSESRRSRIWEVFKCGPCKFIFLHLSALLFLKSQV